MPEENRQAIFETQARKHADERAAREQQMVFVLRTATGLDVCTQEEIYRRHIEESLRVLYTAEPPIPEDILEAYVRNVQPVEHGQSLVEKAHNIARLRWLLPYRHVDHCITVNYNGETKSGRTYSDRHYGPGLLLIIPFTPEEKAARNYATDNYQAYIRPEDILSVHIQNI